MGYALSGFFDQVLEIRWVSDEPERSMLTWNAGLTDLAAGVVTVLPQQGAHFALGAPIGDDQQEQLFWVRLQCPYYALETAMRELKDLCQRAFPRNDLTT